jgi:hypothetical protein
MDVTWHQTYTALVTVLQSRKLTDWFRVVNTARCPNEPSGQVIVLTLRCFRMLKLLYPFVRVHQTENSRTDLYKILYWGVWRKTVGPLHLSLVSDNFKQHTYIPLCAHGRLYPYSAHVQLEDIPALRMLGFYHTLVPNTN